MTQKRNPLAKYLAEKGIKRAEFARGIGVTRARVTQICSDGVAHLELAKRIEDATNGNVPVGAWLKQEAAQ